MVKTNVNSVSPKLLHAASLMQSKKKTKKKTVLWRIEASSLATRVQSCFKIWCKLVHLSLSFSFSYWPIMEEFLHCYDNGVASGSPSQSHTHATSVHSHKKKAHRETGRTPWGYIKNPCVLLKQYCPQVAKCVSHPLKPTWGQNKA